MESQKSSYNVGRYLLDRLAEINITHLFGVPGDFNLHFLDDVMNHEIEWVGCPDELSASYAADGYARMKHAGALLTTYGVGELSALNGVAGSYSEIVPVIHIVGAPPLAVQNKRCLTHHTLGDGVFSHFKTMSEPISCTTTMLLPENAVTEIDRVITEVMYYHRPGYIMLPMDVAVLPAFKPASPLVPRIPELSEASISAFKDGLRKFFKGKTHPVVFTGHLAERFHCVEYIENYIQEYGIPFVDFLLGKGSVNESLPTYMGSYRGARTPDAHKALIEGADIQIFFGTMLSDISTANFSHNLPQERSVEICPFYSSIAGQVFQQIPMELAVAAMHEVTAEFHTNWDKKHLPPVPFPSETDKANEKYEHQTFWNEFQKGIRSDDIIVIDVGSSSFNSQLLRLPNRCPLISSFLWASIGYTLPAAFGAQLAEPNRRVILVIGDGAAQMTFSIVSTIMKFKVNPIIFLMNNNGYEIERHIHGWTEPYNDIAPWNWQPLAKALSTEHQPHTCTVNKKGQVADILKETEKIRKEFIFAEVILPSHTSFFSAF